MNKKLIRIIITAILLAAAYIITKNIAMPMWAQLLVYLVPYTIISFDVLGEAMEGVAEGDPFDENFLMSIATIGALLIGFLPGAETQFPEAVFVMLFFQVGELFEDYAEDKSRKSISELMDIRPDTADVERGGEIMTVAPDTVSIGETVIIKPGEKIPLDGIITEGSSSLNTLALTGESVPKDVDTGDEVVSGCINLSGVIKVKTTKTFGESTVSKIINLVEHSVENKSHSETFITRFAKIYTPIVVYLALATAFIPPLFAPSYAAAFTVWLYRALTFLVVSCPCALVISIPLTFFAGIGGASSKGILIKGGNFMDSIAKARTIVFDKTGTLTKGVFAVDVVHPNVIDANALLHLAAHVERFSSHPIANALREVYPNEDDGCSVEDIEEIAGNGVRAKVNGRKVLVGNEKMMNNAGVVLALSDECSEHVGTVVHVAVDGEYMGHIVISDKLKDDSLHAIESLKNIGIEKTVMLTGDNEKVGHSVARQLGIDEYHASLLPADKVAHVERLLSSASAGEKVVFVGDGINDAPVLARADVGIAMGALGSEAAIEAADVVLMDDKPSKIAEVIRLSRRTIRIAMQNAVFAISVKVLILLLVAVGLLGTYAMSVAVFGDVGVMVLAVVNAMRALRVGK
jgi:Cd2+/Zn2+-exporting ATPase